MIKMIVSDMDGTLLNSNLEISQENLEAISAVRAKGIRFCIATGRPEQLLKEYIHPLNMEDPMIMYNGSVIGHPFKDDNLYELKLATSDAKEIIEYCDKNDIIYMAYTKNKLISKPNYRVSFFEERNKNLTKELMTVFEDIRNIDDIIKNNINKILIIENDDEKYIKVKEKFSAYPQFEIATSQKGFIDINPSKVSKGNALLVLAKYFGLSMDEIVVFGDQDNDISMMKIAGTSVAMKNGCQNAKDVADYITESNNDNGVALWIKNNILN